MRVPFLASDQAFTCFINESMPDLFLIYGLTKTSTNQIKDEGNLVIKHEKGLLEGRQKLHHLVPEGQSFAFPVIVGIKSTSHFLA